MFCLLGWLEILYSKAIPSQFFSVMLHFCVLIHLITFVITLKKFSWLLDVGRLLIGYGIGVLSYVVIVTSSAFCHTNF